LQKEHYEKNKNKVKIEGFPWQKGEIFLIGSRRMRDFASDLIILKCSKGWKQENLSVFREKKIEY
jgi:hypothetical protein